jgi:hypothetical protein
VRKTAHGFPPFLSLIFRLTKIRLSAYFPIELGLGYSFDLEYPAILSKPILL